MIKQSICLAAVAAACVALAAGRPQVQNPESQIQNQSTPGQFQIVDKAGKPAGVCPLTHTDVKVDIAGYVAGVNVTQEFTNPSTTPVEAVYTFPLSEDAAVDQMTMRIGSRVIRGQIKKREEAREIYEAAKSRGQAAALLDQERPNIFTQSVANIMPGDKIQITIHYVNLLKYEAGRYEFVFPMVVGPRFIAGHSQPGVRGADTGQKSVEGDPGIQSVVTDGSKITPPITPKGTRAGHDISLSVNLDAGLPLTDVRSQLHEVDIRRSGQTRCAIKLRDQDSIPNRDFILRYTAAGSEITEGILAHSSLAGIAGTAIPTSHPGGYFTLIIQPPLVPKQEEISPKEMVFVIDQTGSQSGAPIAKAKETMAYCIKNLNPGDTFQLIGFNTNVYPCFQGPVQPTQQNIQKALDYLKPIEGNGGTDILKAADYALKMPDDPGRLRIVCYMTDGYVGNDMQIIDYIRKNRGRARMFPFGVGNSVNRFLIEGMAREGRGAPDYVDLGANGEAIATKFYKRISSPLLLDPKIDWEGMPVADVYPKHIPDVFTAGPIIIKGRYTHPGDGFITLSGMLRGKPWMRKIHVNFPMASQPGSDVIRTLWAREKIEDLQGQDWYGIQAGKTDPKIQAEIESTALEYGLMSQFTSFVAVEERVINAGGKQRTIDVPVEMPEGVDYAGIFGERAAGLTRGNVAAGYASGSVIARRALSVGTGLSIGTAAKSSGGSGALGAMPAGAAAYKRKAGLNQLADTDALSLADDVRTGRAEAETKLAKMTPVQRTKLFREVKLSAELRKLLEKLAGTKLIEVQIWLGDLPPAGLDKLKAKLVKLSATLITNKLVLAVVDLDKLDALLELPFVRRIELPRYK